MKLKVRLRESSEVVTIGLYGDEDSFDRVGSIIKYGTLDLFIKRLESSGLTVSNLERYGLSGDWELDVTGPGNLIYKLVCGSVGGYNSSSEEEFISEYSI